LATPDDVTQLLSMTQGIAGFFGASSVERLPTEIAIEAQVRSFKNVLSGTQS
jgi:predicted TIM-barrel enzyme